MNTKPLQPHQQRVVQERDELGGRVDSLRTFIRSDTFNSVPSPEQSRLLRQFEVMHELLNILNERIVAF